MPVNRCSVQCSAWSGKIHPYGIPNQFRKKPAGIKVIPYVNVSISYRISTGSEYNAGRVTVNFWTISITQTATKKE